MVRMTMFQHACIPKELHQTYDLLKILEKQKEIIKMIKPKLNLAVIL